MSLKSLYGPLLASVAVVSGGYAAFCALSIREINQHSWGWYPVEEIRALMVGLLVGALVCLGAAFWWTHQSSPDE